MAIDYSRLPSDASAVEILSAAMALKTKKEKIELLRKYGERADFMYILRGAYAPNITWLVPDGPLPAGSSFNSAPSIDTADDRLIRGYRQFMYLVKGGPQMKQAKREDIYLNILRAVHKTEAELLMSIVSKKIPGISRALCLETFPDWIPKSNELSE